MLLPHNKLSTLVRFLIKFAFGVLCTLSLSLLGVLLWQSLIFFTHVDPFDFLLGVTWNPTVTPGGECLYFGALPLICGTLLVTFVSICLAAPVSFYAGIYLSEYMPESRRARIKVLLEVFSGIPTVVYGIFAALFLAPLFNHWGRKIGLEISLESALVTGAVMGLMNFPFLTALTDEILRSLPVNMRQAGLALGATKGEVVRHILFVAARPGLVALILLAIARTIGETMIVILAAGLTANLTLNPFEATTTITVQLASLLMGDQSPDNPKTQAAFALGLLLFALTLTLNILGKNIIQRYRVHYA